MDYIALGQRIRRFRKQKCLTQEALAKHVGITASFLGHIERGTRILSLETLMGLCRALEVTPNDLLGCGDAPLHRELPERVCISPAALMENIAAFLEKQKILQ